MKFVNPLILLAVIPVALLCAALYFSAVKRRRDLLKRILGSRADDPEACDVSHTKRNWKFILMLTAVILLIIAAARPYIRSSVIETKRDSRDVLLIFDVSKSMRAVDLPPSRMAQAKYLARQIINAFPHDRFGVIPFAGRAYLSCPLTADHHALLAAVDDLDYSSVPVGGTNISSALECAVNALKAADSAHIAVILFTDGDELSGNGLSAAKKLRELNIPLAAVGFGSPDVEVPVPDDDGKGVMHSASGEVAGTKLNEEMLKKLSSAADGIYLRSTVEDTGFIPLKEFITSLVPGESINIKETIPEDLFGYFIGVALILLFISGLIPEYISRKVFLCGLIFCGLTLLAADETEKLLPEERYRNALDLQRSGNENAVKAYEKLLSSADIPDVLRGRSFQNLGVFYHHDGRTVFDNAANKLKTQDIRGALDELNKCIEKYNNTGELYRQAMNISDDKENENMRAENLRQLISDKKHAQELKKKIEEMLKQQQQSQQQTGKAREQNQKNQQNSQKNQQNSQKNQQENAQKASNSAAQSAEKLADQAESLGQKDLAEKAKSAAEDLREAEKLQQQGKYSKAAEKIDGAAEKLRHGEEKSDGKKEDGKDTPGEQKQQDGSEKNESDKNEKDGQLKNIEKEPQKNEEKKNAEKAIDLLENEADSLRDNIRRHRNVRRRPAEKDW